MSVERIERMKKSKFFQPHDLIIYGVLLLLVALSFLLVTLGKQSDKKIAGVEINYKNAVIGSYTLQDGLREEKHGEDISFEVSESNGKVKIIIRLPEGVNELSIDKPTGDAYMTNADCHGEDCTKMKIEKSADFIACVPHRLTITPITDDDLYIPQDITV